MHNHVLYYESMLEKAKGLPEPSSREERLRRKQELEAARRKAYPEVFRPKPAVTEELNPKWRHPVKPLNPRRYFCLKRQQWHEDVEWCNLFLDSPDEPEIPDEVFMDEYTRCSTTNPEHLRLYLKYCRVRESQGRSHINWTVFQAFLKEREERVFAIDAFEARQRSPAAFEDSSDSEYELEIDDLP